MEQLTRIRKQNAVFVLSLGIAIVPLIILILPLYNTYRNSCKEYTHIHSLSNAIAFYSIFFQVLFIIPLIYLIVKKPKYNKVKTIYYVELFATFFTLLGFGCSYFSDFHFDSRLEKIDKKAIQERDECCYIYELHDIYETDDKKEMVYGMFSCSCPLISKNEKCKSPEQIIEYDIPIEKTCCKGKELIHNHFIYNQMYNFILLIIHIFICIQGYKLIESYKKVYGFKHGEEELV